MKVAASVAALAFAASAVAVPAWPVEETTTTTSVAPVTTEASTWADWTSTTTVPVDVTSTTTSEVVSETWADWEEPDSWTTTIVPEITTVVPEPTTIVHAGKSWVITASTTLVITDGPLTISVPVYTKTSTSCAETPVAATSTWADWESETPAPVAPETYVPSATGVKPAAFTGAANSLVANVGAGLAGVGAIAAFLL